MDPSIRIILMQEPILLPYSIAIIIMIRPNSVMHIIQIVHMSRKISQHIWTNMKKSIKMGRQWLVCQAIVFSTWLASFDALALRNIKYMNTVMTTMITSIINQQIQDIDTLCKTRFDISGYEEDNLSMMIADNAANIFYNESGCQRSHLPWLGYRMELFLVAGQPCYCPRNSY